MSTGFMQCCGRSILPLTLLKNRRKALRFFSSNVTSTITTTTSIEGITKIPPNNMSSHNIISTTNEPSSLSYPLIDQLSQFTHLDSYKYIVELQKDSSFTRQQSEAIVQTMGEILAEKLTIQAVTLLESSNSLEEDISQLKAIQRTDHLNLIRIFNVNTSTNRCIREDLLSKVSDLNDSIRERIASLKVDSAAALATYTEENREKEQRADVGLHRINGLFTVAQGEYKARLESVKLKAISLFSGCLLSFFLLVIGERAWSYEIVESSSPTGNRK